MSVCGCVCAGASVLNTRCSETYKTRSACLSLFGIPLWYHSESPRTVIQVTAHTNAPTFLHGSPSAQQIWPSACVCVLAGAVSREVLGFQRLSGFPGDLLVVSRHDHRRHTWTHSQRSVTYRTPGQRTQGLFCLRESIFDILFSFAKPQLQ